MTSKTEKKTFVLGDVKVKAVYFSSQRTDPKDSHHYVVLAEGVTSKEWNAIKFQDYARERKRATGLALDDSTESRFWLVCCADCIDPPVAIVRAANESDAEEIFVDELPWSHLDEAAQKDILDDCGGDEEKASEQISWGPSGQAYDSQGVVIHEVFPVRVDF